MKQGGKSEEGVLSELDHRTAQVDLLRGENQLLRSIIESQKDILIFSIDRNYIYRHFNDAFWEATNHAYGTKVSVGMSMLESITSDADREKIKANCDLAFSGRSHLTVEEFGEANRAYFETRYNPITNGSEITGVTVLSANISERVKAELKVKELNKELESFGYMAAHDLKGPLRAIGGYSYLLSRMHGNELSTEARKLLEVIDSSVKHMSRLIDAILNLSRLGQTVLKRRPVDMTVLAREVIDEQLKMFPREHIEVNIGTLGAAEGDPVLLRHVFTNLVSNALKYSSKRPVSKIEIGCSSVADSVTYFVRDNGTGFDMKFADKLFSAFHRLHPQSDYEGSGIGLTIVQKIVDNHGGKTWAEGELDKGATFYFSLPGEGVSSKEQGVSSKN